MHEDLRTNSHEVLTANQREFSHSIYEIGAIKFGSFKLKLHDNYPEAPPSPIYLDLRILRRFPQAKETAVEIFSDLVDPLEFDLLSDIPTASTPLVSSLADKLSVGMISPRMDAKNYGSGERVDGLKTEDEGVVALLLDDLVTHADSKIKAINILRQNGVVVNDLAVLIDRQQGAKKILEEQGVRLHSSLILSQLLDFYADKEIINHQDKLNIDFQLNELNKYLESQYHE